MGLRAQLEPRDQQAEQQDKLVRRDKTAQQDQREELELQDLRAYVERMVSQATLVSQDQWELATKMRIRTRHRLQEWQSQVKHIFVLFTSNWASARGRVRRFLRPKNFEKRGTFNATKTQTLVANFLNVSFVKNVFSVDVLKILAFNLLKLL